MLDVSPARVPEILLCGYERGGTTLLSELFRANGFESGFECGVLMGRSPKEFPHLKEYWDMLPGGWGIDTKARDTLAVDDFTEFYSKLTALSFPSHTGPFFDKTPRYMETLGQCLHRVPFVRNAVVVFRDPIGTFLSQAKRLSPGLAGPQAVEKNFESLKSRYLRYFIGSAAHFWNPRVLFVPFEDLVTREQIWLSILGNFVRGRPFGPRGVPSRFDNVETGMKREKASDGTTGLPEELQERILEATALASVFHSDVASRSKRGGVWAQKADQITRNLENFGLPKFGYDVDGEYFEPMTYLLRYEDVLAAGMNPVEHYRLFGKRERRQPA